MSSVSRSAERRRTPSLPSAAVLALAAATAVVVAAQAEEWRPLFNGRDLAGWVNVNCAPGTFSVRDGLIHSTGAPICALRTDRMYENFELELEYQHLKPGGNAGLFIWADALPARGQPFLRAIEVQILDGRNGENYTSHGDVFPIHGAKMTPDRPHPGGWMRSLPRERRAKPAGQWNHYRIVANRGTISLAVNGKEVTTGSEASPRKGYIALESEGSPTLFRNIRIRELPPGPSLRPDQIASADEGFRSLYTGVDLQGWKVTATHEGRWTVKDWTLVYSPAQSAATGSADEGMQLESAGLFGNVIVRFDWWVPKGTSLPAAVPLHAAPFDADGGRILLTPIPVGSGPETGGGWHRTELTVRGREYLLTMDGEGARGGTIPGPSGRRRPLVLNPADVPVEFANIFVKPLN